MSPPFTYLLARVGHPWCLAFTGAALVFVWRCALRKQTRLITDYATVATEDPSEFEYDHVIVGGGTAGCVLASRLTEDPSVHVLLIEAGTSGKALAKSRIPSAFLSLAHTKHDYDLYTTPQPHAGGEKNYLPRARLLGGCSSINAQMAQYGAPSDYDEIAKIIGDDSWAWESFSKYFRKFESYNPHPRFPYVDVAEHGSSGPVAIGHGRYAWRGGDMFIQACVNVGIPFSPDFTTTKGTMGVNKVVSYIDPSGVRSSTEAAYLTPAVLARPNLKVITGARVTRILFDSGSGGEPRAIGAEFSAFDARGAGKKFRAGARKEVIVCCGAVHTPQLLMLSGIGTASHLAEHNIPLVLDAPGVGANLLDHVSARLCIAEKTGISLAYLKPSDLRSRLKLVRDVLRYQIWGTGPLSSNLGEAAAFVRANDPVLFPPSEYTQDIEDSTSGPGAPDIEVVIAPLIIHLHDRSLDTLDGYTLLVCLLRPTSAGTIRLNSADAWDDPVIDPNYLATQHDVDVLVRGVRLALRIARTAPMAQLMDAAHPHPSLDHDVARLSDAEVREAVRARSATFYHPFGTCAMGPRAEGSNGGGGGGGGGGGAGVLDSEMKVRGVGRLRVCDASIFPKIVAGHTAGIVIAAAEKLADMIKAERAAPK